MVEIIEKTNPPAYPPPFSCNLNIPESVPKDFKQRYAAWVSEQLVQGNFDAFVDQPVHVMAAGNPTDYLVAFPKIACAHGSHNTPGTAVFVMNQTGQISEIHGEAGLFYPAQVDRQVTWDGKKWLVLINKQFLYWGSNSTQFYVWHIYQDQSGQWTHREFTLPAEPFTWLVDGYPYIEALYNDHVIVGGGNYYDRPPPCPLDADMPNHHAIWQLWHTFRFDGTAYNLEKQFEEYYVWDDNRQRIKNWRQYCQS
ncbi:MAG: hypothetical protein AAF614_10810 [Chloroflexota bacterium]